MAWLAARQRSRYRCRSTARFVVCVCVCVCSRARLLIDLNASGATTADNRDATFDVAAMRWRHPICKTLTIFLKYFKHKTTKSFFDVGHLFLMPLVLFIIIFFLVWMGDYSCKIKLNLVRSDSLDRRTKELKGVPPPVLLSFHYSATDVSSPLPPPVHLNTYFYLYIYIFLSYYLSSLLLMMTMPGRLLASDDRLKSGLDRGDGGAVDWICDAN